MLNHTKLHSYQRSLMMLKALQVRMPKWRLPSGAKDQIQRAMISVLLNQAEGCGKMTAKDKCKFFSIARGSLLEVGAGLDVAEALCELTAADNQNLQSELLIIAKQLSKLIRATMERFPNPSLNLNLNRNSVS